MLNNILSGICRPVKSISCVLNNQTRSFNNVDSTLQAKNSLKCCCKTMSKNIGDFISSRDLMFVCLFVPGTKELTSSSSRASKTRAGALFSESSTRKRNRTRIPIQTSSSSSRTTNRRRILIRMFFRPNRFRTIYRVRQCRLAEK